MECVGKFVHKGLREYMHSYQLNLEKDQLG